MSSGLHVDFPFVMPFNGKFATRLFLIGFDLGDCIFFKGIEFQQVWRWHVSQLCFMSPYFQIHLYHFYIILALVPEYIKNFKTNLVLPSHKTNSFYTEPMRFYWKVLLYLKSLNSTSDSSMHKFLKGEKYLVVVTTYRINKVSHFICCVARYLFFVNRKVKHAKDRQIAISWNCIAKYWQRNQFTCGRSVFILLCTGYCDIFYRLIPNYHYLLEH